MGMQLDPGGNLKSFLSKEVTLRLSLGVWEMGMLLGQASFCWVLPYQAGAASFRGEAMECGETTPHAGT